MRKISLWDWFGLSIRNA